jgi:tetratricopeptide (TPR) repeat protein
VAQLSWGQQMLNSSGTDVVKQRLHIALADLHNLAGWTSFGAGFIDSAYNHFGRALQLAKAGDSDGLIANILYRMGQVYLKNDAPEDALKMFQLALIAAQQAGLDRGVAVICANQAWAHAMMGHEEQMAKCVGRTREAFARLDPTEVAAVAEEVDVAANRSHGDDVARINFIRKLLPRQDSPKTGAP